MKLKTICGLFLIMVSGYAYGQPCPGDSLFLNSVTVPGLVLPTGTTTAQDIFVGSGNSSYITTSPGAATNLLAVALPEFIGNAQIVISSNFQTDIGESGSFSASIDECGRIEVSAPTAPIAGASPATKLVVYPTVSKGSVTVTGGAADLTNANILVIDETGRIVFSTYNAANTSLNLDLGRLANGLYFVQIRQAAKTSTQRIIINK